jgi:hypothetical protein
MITCPECIERESEPAELDTPIGSPLPEHIMTPEQAKAGLRLFKGECTDVREIVTAYLAANGYDGLANDECGCGLKDFAPCEEGPCPDCRPAHIGQPRRTVKRAGTRRRRKRDAE